MYYNGQVVWHIPTNTVRHVREATDSAWCWDATALAETEPLVDPVWGTPRPFVNDVPGAEAALAAGTVIPKSRYVAPSLPPHAMRVWDMALIERLPSGAYRYTPAPRAHGNLAFEVFEAPNIDLLLWRMGIAWNAQWQVRDLIEALPLPATAPTEDACPA
jgi:hypothetical protein